MKKIFIILLAIVLVAFAFYFYTNSNGRKLANLVSPGFNPLETNQKSEPIPSSTPNMKAPKSFTYGASTDLKAELEKVNPQILDSDFE